MRLTEDVNRIVWFHIYRIFLLIFIFSQLFLGSYFESKANHKEGLNIFPSHNARKYRLSFLFN